MFLDPLSITAHYVAAGCRVIPFPTRAIFCPPLVGLANPLSRITLPPCKQALLEARVINSSNFLTREQIVVQPSMIEFCVLIPVSNFTWGQSLAVRAFFANVAIISRTTIEIFN